MCSVVSVLTSTSELNGPKYLFCWFALTLSRLSSQVQFVSQNLEKSPLFGYGCMLQGGIFYGCTLQCDIFLVDVFVQK